VDVIESFPQSRFFLVGDSGEQDMELYAAIAKERPQQILAVLIRDANDWDAVKPLDDPTGIQARNAKPNLTPLRPASPTSTVENISFIETGRRSPTAYIARQTKKARSLNLSQHSFSGANGVSEFDPSYPMPMSTSPTTELPAMSYPPPAYPRRSTTHRQNSDVSTISNLSLRPSITRRTSNGSIRGVPPMTSAEKKQFDLQTRVYRARSTIPDHIPLRVFRDPEECVETGDVLNQMDIGMGTSQC
jgi:hypothetical protein